MSKAAFTQRDIFVNILKMLFLRLVLLTIITLIPANLPAEVREYRLSNGLKVLMVEDHKSPLAVFQIWYRVGSMDEAAGKTGMSHLLEHMMFKGTKKYGSKALSRTVMKNGGVDNAFTSKDYTAYYQILPSDRMELSLEFESDRMRNLMLEEDEILYERNVVMEERRLRYEDDPQSSLYEDVVAAAFKVHPYHWPVIGWMSDLASIEKEHLLEHYKSYYSPGNAVIVVVGDIDPDEMMGKIREYFSGIEPGVERKVTGSVEPEQRGERRVYLRREAELPHALAVYHTPTLDHEDGYALDVLSTVLSGGKSGRLYRSLVYEKKLAQGAFADYHGISRDPSLFYLGATAAPGTDIAVLEGALFEEVEKMKGEPPTEFEVEKAKNQIESSYIMSLDSIFFQAQLLGRLEVMGDWRMIETYIRNIRKVTPEDVRKVADKYLARDNRTVGILIPEGK
jgi:zinc protease